MEPTPPTPPASQVTDRDRLLEAGGAWEAPTDPPGEPDERPDDGEVDPTLEPGGFFESPVGPDEAPSR